MVYILYRTSDQMNLFVGEIYKESGEHQQRRTLQKKKWKICSLLAMILDGIAIVNVFVF